MVAREAAGLLQMPLDSWLHAVLLEISRLWLGICGALSFYVFIHVFSRRCQPLFFSIAFPFGQPCLAKVARLAWLDGLKMTSELEMSRIGLDWIGCRKRHGVRVLRR